jgi:hypothetical protein
LYLIYYCRLQSVASQNEALINDFNILRNLSMENCQFEKRMNELWAESGMLAIAESDLVEAPITNRKRASKEEKVIF